MSWHDPKFIKYPDKLTKFEFTNESSKLSNVLEYISSQIISGFNPLTNHFAHRKVSTIILPKHLQKQILVNHFREWTHDTISDKNDIAASKHWPKDWFCFRGCTLDPSWSNVLKEHRTMIRYDSVKRTKSGTKIRIKVTWFPGFQLKIREASNIAIFQKVVPRSQILVRFDGIFIRQLCI